MAGGQVTIAQIEAAEALMGLAMTKTSLLPLSPNLAIGFAQAG